MEEEIEYNKRISDRFLRGEHFDGEVFTHEMANEIEQQCKQGINANYVDIQKLELGEIVVEKARQLEGITVSEASVEPLQDDDTKIPTSKQVKAYIDEGGAGTEMVANKVTSITSSSTDTQYPSAKAVYDLFTSITDFEGVEF